jgi:hypothetical protein
VSFHQSLHHLLRLNTNLSRKEGEEVNVGETFTLQFTLWNDAPDVLGPATPRIVFTPLQLTIQATAFATPLQDGKPVLEATFSFADATLGGGEQTTVEVNLQAIRNMHGLEHLLSREEVAEVLVTADLDLAQYFQVRLHRPVYEEIAS